MIALVDVDVALRRPPRADRRLRYAIAVDVDGLEVAAAERAAELAAQQWAASRPGVVMPVASRVVEVLEV